MKFAPFEEFKNLAEHDKYYDPSRWDLYSRVQQLIADQNPQSLLELGAYRFPLVVGSDTMDRTEEFQPTIAHDARVTPWPIEDDAYDMFVSLQVWDHLKGTQQAAFCEVRRIARQAILSFPYRWDCPDRNPSHHGITEETIIEWTLGVPAEEVVIIPSQNNHRRIIYRFDFTKSNSRRHRIIQRKSFTQKSLEEPVPTLRRTPEECRYRMTEKQGTAEVSRCQFVELIFDKYQKPIEYAVQKDACQACITEFEPTPNNFNSVVSSLIYRQVLQHPDNKLNDGSLAQLSKQAENGLRMVLPEEPTPELKTRSFGDCVHLGSCIDNASPVADHKCKHPKRERANPEVCHLCPDHREASFNEADQLLNRLPLEQQGQPVESWMVGVTTAPRKASTLDQTLDSVLRAGWPSPWLFLDSAVEVAERHQHLPVTYREAAVGAWSNFYLSLSELMHRNPHADAYMMLQDDILLTNSENLRDYLEQILWPNDKVGVVSLFCSEHYDKPESGWHCLEESWVWGSTAFIFSNQSAWEFIADPEVIAHRKSERYDGTRLIDVTVGKWLQRTNKEIIYPVPSLVQHTGARSTLWESATNTDKRQAARFIE